MKRSFLDQEPMTIVAAAGDDSMLETQTHKVRSQNRPTGPELVHRLLL